MTVALTAISMSRFPSTPAGDNSSLLSNTKRAFDTTITVRRSAWGTWRWFIMHRVGMRSAQSALTLPYNDDEDDGELIVIVDETGFLFQWTWAGNSSDYFRIGGVSGVGWDIRGRWRNHWVLIKMWVCIALLSADTRTMFVDLEKGYLRF